MITDQLMHRKALRVLTGLESRIKSGEHTPAERERAAVVRDHVLVWEWAQDSRPAVEVTPRELAPPLSPRAAQFCGWWDRARYTAQWAGREWLAAFCWFTRPAFECGELRGRDLVEIAAEVQDELTARDTQQERAA